MLFSFRKVCSDLVDSTFKHQVIAFFLFIRSWGNMTSSCDIFDTPYHYRNTIKEEGEEASWTHTGEQWWAVPNPNQRANRTRVLPLPGKFAMSQDPEHMACHFATVLFVMLSWNDRLPLPTLNKNSVVAIFLMHKWAAIYRGEKSSWKAFHLVNLIIRIKEMYSLPSGVARTQKFKGNCKTQI